MAAEESRDVVESRKKEVHDVSYTTEKSDVDRETDPDVKYKEQEVNYQQPTSIMSAPPPAETQHDEDTTYNDLFISNVNSSRFQPPKITGEVAPDIYQTREDDIQFDPPEYVETACKCADGSKSTGKKNIRTGQIDCDCNKNLATTPDIYDPPPNKERVIETKDLKDQAGVSYMGNVKLEPCDVPDNEMQERANATLNKVVQIGKETSEETPRGKRINKCSNSLSIYDTCNYNYHGI